MTILICALVSLAIGLVLSRVSWVPPVMKSKAFPVLLCLLPAVLFLTGCTAAWLSAVSAMLPSIVTLVTSIVSFAIGLKGGTISPETAAFIQKVAADVQAEIVNVQTLIADYKNSPDNTTLGKISAVFSGIVTSLGSILSGANITNSATTSKLTQLVGLAVAAIQAVLGLLPLVTKTMTEFGDKAVNEEAVKHADGQASDLIKHHHKALQEGYHAVVVSPSGEADVDKVLMTLPTSI